MQPSPSMPPSWVRRSRWLCKDLRLISQGWVDRKLWGIPQGLGKSRIYARLLHGVEPRSQESAGFWKNRYKCQESEQGGCACIWERGIHSQVFPLLLILLSIGLKSFFSPLHKSVVSRIPSIAGSIRKHTLFSGQPGPNWQPVSVNYTGQGQIQVQRSKRSGFLVHGRHL